VYGDGNRNFLVAIVVPDKTYVMKFAQSNGISGEFEELCKNPTVNADILKNLE
jgi:long-chain acyl-CoA synthetase